jgi:DNA-binding NtrC family response regulator
MAEWLETILVVDDTAAEREVVTASLKCANFHILEADGAATAIELASTYDGRIALLLSALEMPVMSGPNLGEALRKTHPDVHMMFMTGISGGNLWVFNHEWTLIEKPLLPAKLPEIVTNVLHSPLACPASNPYDARRLHSNRATDMRYTSYVTHISSTVRKAVRK